MLVDQFLHGYANGHRLLAASRQPDEATASALLSHSDAPAIPRTRVLASLPLPPIRSWALTSIWPAEDAPRPGSVWSHTLLLDDEALNSLEGAGGLLEAFSMPTERNDLSRFSLQAEVADRPISVGSDDRTIAEAILLATYGWPGKSTAVLAPNLDAAAKILLAIWQRQWPALRASYSFRTRLRLSEEAKAGLEVALQPSRREGAGRVEIAAEASIDERPNPPWLGVLADDLERNRGPIQELLRTFGPEAPKGWSDFPTLGRILSEASNPATGRSAFSALVLVYPEPAQMEGLKLAMLRRESAVWIAPEIVRLEVAITNAEALPWKQLDLPGRTLDFLEQGDLDDFFKILELAGAADQTESGPGQEILGAVREKLKPKQLRGLAERSPSSAARILELHPAPLLARSFWTGSPPWLHDLLIALADRKISVPPHPFLDEVDDEITREALALRVVDPLAIGAALAEGGANCRQLARWQEVFPASAGISSKELLSEMPSWQQIALALAADPKPSRGLVRKYAHEMAEHFEDMDSDVRIRLAAEIFESAGAGKLEPEAVGRSFAILHRSSTKKESREELLSLLPRFQVSQDELRVALRRALVEIVKEERWEPEDLAVALYNAGPGAKKVRDLTPKKSEVRKVFDAAGKLVKDAVKMVRGR